jgi:hypothetical protein
MSQYKTEYIMRQIQDADVTLAYIEVSEDYDFANDINLALEQMGKYSRMYYNRMERYGYTYEEAKEKLGAFMKKSLGIVKKEVDDEFNDIKQ